MIFNWTQFHYKYKSFIVSYSLGHIVFVAVMCFFGQVFLHLMRGTLLGLVYKSFCLTTVKDIWFNFLHDSSPHLSAEEHVGQQLQQISLADHRPEKEFSDEAGCDAPQHGTCKEDLGKALLIPWVKEADHLAEGVLSFLLQAFNEQSCL